MNLVHLFVAISLTIIFVDSKFLEPIRKSIRFITYIFEDIIGDTADEYADYILKCYQCQGFWISYILFLLLNNANYVEGFQFALIGSLASLFVGKAYQVLKLIEANLRNNL